MNAAALLTKLLKRDTLHLGLAPASRQPAGWQDPAPPALSRPGLRVSVLLDQLSSSIPPLQPHHCQPGLGKPLIHYLPLL